MFGRRKYKRFFYLLLVLPLPLYAATALFNYYIDPMWCFKHDNCYNCVQSDIDDRQLKTDYLTYRGEKGSYDTLMIGNSRVMLMNQNDFGPHTFNYAVAGMLPKEFPDYIDFAKKANGRNFKRIVLGLSFAPTNEECGYYAGKAPSYYIDNVKNPFYRYELLLSWDVLKHSFLNMKFSRKCEVTVYTDRNNVRHIKKERVKLDENLARDLKSTVDGYNHFKYLEQYHSLMETIRNSNPGTEFTVFTTPVSKPLFCAVVNEGRLPDYERWLRESVDVFGQVYHFENLNSVTRDYRHYYMDGHHYYPETGTLIAHRVQGVPDPAVPADFGMVLTKSNIDEKLKEIEATAQECR